MTPSVRTVTGILIIFLIAMWGCTPGKEQFDIGMKLQQQGKSQEALAYLEQAVQNEPANQSFQKALGDLKRQIIDDHLRLGKQALQDNARINREALNNAKTRLEMARKVDPNDPAVNQFAQTVQTQETTLLNKVTSLYDIAKQNMAAGEWLKAVFNLQQIQEIFPNYEDSTVLLNQSAESGTADFFKQAQTKFDTYEFPDAIALARKAVSLKSDFEPARELMRLAQERNNKDFFLTEGRKAIENREWDTAVKLYSRVLKYDPNNPELRTLLGEVETNAGLFYLQQSESLMEQGWAYKAVQAYELARKYKTQANGAQLASLQQKLANRLDSLASRMLNQDMLGAAWVAFITIQDFYPDYPNIAYTVQNIETLIGQRVRKSIAVFDFQSPSTAPDAGVIFANKLITFLFKSASKNIKILERENLKSILEEMKLGQIGVVSNQTAKEMGRVYGIDIAVMGSVLRYKVDATVYNDTKSVVYQVKKREENIDYLNWSARNPNPTKEELAVAPAPYHYVMDDVEKQYNVSIHRKVGFVELSFRIVDVDTGENIQVRTITRKRKAEDETSAGVQIAGVKFDPLEIPTDTELLQIMSDEVITELGQESLKPFDNLERQYFQEGENLLRRRNRLVAAEKFVDAIFSERVKQIEDSFLSRKAQEYLEQIFIDYKEN